MNTPKLRFREFSDEWNREKISDLLELKERPLEMKDDFLYNLVTVKRRYGGVEKRTRLCGKDILVKSQFLLKQGDFLISKRQIVHGACGLVPEFLDGSIVSNEYNVFIPKIRTNIKCFNYSMQRSRMKQLFFLSDGVHIEKMLFKTNSWMKQQMFFPTIEEQQKIADFLSNVDEKTTNQQALVDSLKQQKRGFMQKLFSQEIRFKDENGQDYPKWETKRLRTVSDVRDGTHDTPKYVVSGKPLVTSKNLTKNGTLDFSDVSYINENDYQLINKRSNVDKGDILFGMIGTIGNPVLVKDCDFAIKNVALIKENKESYNRFLIYYLKSNIIARQFYQKNAGGTQKFISLDNIRNLEIGIPVFSEQQEIADFLSTYDDKIAVEERQLLHWQNIKKGLLQQMFV